MAIGIRNEFITAADLVVVSAALVSTTLTSPIAAGQIQKVRAWVKFSVGATGGVRSLVSVPAGGTLLSVTTRLNNTVAPSITEAVANTVFTNALANAGTHWLEIEAFVVNGLTAGNVDIQIGQNTTDALTLTVLRGSSLEVVKL